MSENWNEIELKASVEAYIEMHNLEGCNKPFSKKQYYTELAKKFGRTEKAYEYRMQNISYVYSLQGRQWVSGLKPARNVGAKVIQTLERIIAECEGQALGSNTSLLATIEKLEGVLDAPPPPGSKSPSKVQASVTQFSRDPAVVAWVLAAANGQCERCDLPAPFKRESGSPFLEVHHVRRLADGGEDTIENAVALCPNCHRELHYGSNKAQLADKLREKISRLHTIKQ